MKSWLRRTFERVIGEPKDPEANLSAEEQKKRREQETEIATIVNSRRPFF